MKPVISLQSGREFNFLNPSESEFTIKDIAKALSHICRFTGHTSRFYSVAQHSFHTSFLVPDEYALQALLHDAAEAFIGDVSTPLKQLLPDYKALEKRVEAVVFDRFDLPTELHESVKRADLRMLKWEAEHLMPAACQRWDILQGVESMGGHLIPMSPSQAFSEFCLRYQEITGKNPYL